MKIKLYAAVLFSFLCFFFLSKTKNIYIFNLVPIYNNKNSTLLSSNSEYNENKLFLRVKANNFQLKKKKIFLFFFSFYLIETNDTTVLYY